MLAATQLANCFMRAPVTSEIIPRPYWAIAPDICRSWETITRVPLPAGVIVEVTVAEAWPLPFSSDRWPS